MPKRHCTKGQRDFAKNVASGRFKSNTEAARAANYKHPKEQAVRLMKSDLVIEEIERQKRLFAKAEERAAENIAKRGLLKPIVTKREIETMLLKEARNAESDSARVRALNVLADIKGMRISRNLDIAPELEGKTEEELDFFAVNGYFPDEPLHQGKSSPTGSPSGSPPPADPVKDR